MHPEHLHHVCALMTTQRFLVQTLVRQSLRMRANDYEPIVYMPVLFELLRLIRFGVCTETRTLSRDELPPLLPLINQLPAHMQGTLEQAIEAEVRGEATHEAFSLEKGEVERAFRWLFEADYQAQWEARRARERRDHERGGWPLPPQSGGPAALR